MNELNFHIVRLSSVDFATRRSAAEMLGEFGDQASIKPLLQLLGDDYWQVRNTVVEALLKIRDKTSISHLIDCLRDEDAGVRNSAMSVLNEMGEDVVAPLARLLLEDKSEDVRIFSANTLGRLHSHDSVSALVKGLVDTDENVRYACAEGLGRLGRIEAVVPLIEAMGKEETWSRFPYITALGLIGDERACNVLMGMLDDDILCFPAVIALGQIGDISALLPMVTLLATVREQAIMRAAVVCIAQIEAKTAFLSKVERQSFFHAEVVKVMKALDSTRLVELLVEMVTGNDEMEVDSALMMLRFVKGTIPVERLFHLLDEETLEDAVRDIIVRQGADAMPLVVAGLSADDSRKNRHLIRTVGLLGSVGEVAPLAALLDSPFPDVVCDTLKAIGMLNGVSCFGRMASMLESPVESIRTAAVGGISLLQKKGELLQKVMALSKSENELVRWGGYRVLGHMSSVEAEDILLGGLADESAYARAAAVQSLGYVAVKNHKVVEKPGNFAALGRLLLDESDTVRVEAALAFARINSPQIHSLLLSMLENENGEVLNYVIRAVGKCAITGAGPTLCRLLEAEDGIERKIFICSALGRCGWREAIPYIEPLMDDPTPELAAEAILAMALIGGEDAAAEILPYLGSESWIVQNAVIGALAELGASSAAGALAAFMLSVRDDHERWLLVRSGMRALGKIGGAGEAETIVSLMGNPLWQYEAVGALRGIWSRTQVPLDISKITDPNTRRLMCSVVGMVDRDTAACLNDSYPSVRRVTALASLQNPGLREMLVQQAKSEQDFWGREILRQILLPEEK